MTNTKTGLWALLVFSAAAMINCGGSSDSNDNDPKAGSPSTAGSAGSAGSSNTAGASTGGTSGNTAGTSGNTAGNNNVGGDDGPAQNSGGDDGGPDFPGFGGDGSFPGAGGDGNFGLEECPEGAANGEACTRVDGNQQANTCSQGDSFCSCVAQGQADTGMWFCLGGGEGGAGFGFPGFP
jgi:hypothetical protein